MKCSRCGKQIINGYYLNGKVYGYNCYKEELSILKAKLTEEHNKEYNLKCTALINTFSNITYKNEYNNNFKNSILTQWNSCQKLTMNQFKCIFNKFNNIQAIEYKLTLLELLEDKEAIKEINYNIYSSIDNSILNIYKEDRRILNVIQFQNKYNNTKIEYIFNYKENSKNFTKKGTKLMLEELKEDLEDGYISNLQIYNIY